MYNRILCRFALICRLVAMPPKLCFHPVLLCSVVYCIALPLLWDKAFQLLRTESFITHHYASRKFP